MPIKNNNLKQLLNEIKSKSFIYWQKLHENDKETEIKVKLGKIKDMHKDKVTLTKLYDMMTEFVQETRQNFNKVNGRLDRLEKDVSVLKSDVALIKSCPTIKKEIAELNSSK